MHSKASGAAGGLVSGADADSLGQAMVGNAGGKAWTQKGRTQLSAAKHWALGPRTMTWRKHSKSGMNFPEVKSWLRRGDDHAKHKVPPTISKD